MSQEIKVTVENGIKELVLREGKANPIHIPNGIEVSEMTIDAVQEYLKKEGVIPEEIKNSFITYSVKGLYIKLDFAIRRENKDAIHGKLTIDPDLEKFGINSGNQFTTFALANFIRMNRHYFETKDIALKLVTELQNFKAKVDKEIEASDDKKANIKMMLVQKVTSNIPTEFTLLLPIFTGTSPVPIKVEIDIDANDLSCSLVSPDLKELIDKESKAIIDTELFEIRKLYPELKIFQK